VVLAPSVADRTLNDLALLDLLDEDECLAFLASAPVGRAAITDQAMPAILPINLVVAGSDVIIRSVTGSQLPAAPPQRAAAACGQKPDTPLPTPAAALPPARLLRGGRCHRRIDRNEPPRHRLI
jgi:hypothetical protein